MRPSTLSITKSYKVYGYCVSPSGFQTIFHLRGQLVSVVLREVFRIIFTMGEEKLSKRMIFPYTYTAKIVQFPIKLHMKHHWMFPWFVGATILVAPLFYKIQQFANCDANIKIWAEKRRVEEEHFKHKWD